MLEVLKDFNAPEGRLAAFRDASRRLARALPAKVREYLATLGNETVVALKLDAMTSVIPWEWMEIDASPLFLRNPVTRSADAQQALALQWPTIDRNANVLVIANPTGDLRGARAEGEAIAELYRARLDGSRVQLLMDTEATFGAIARAIRQTNFGVIHFAGHGEMRIQSLSSCLPGARPFARENCVPCWPRRRQRFSS